MHVATHVLIGGLTGLFTATHAAAERNLFTINEDCGQFGEEPASIEESLVKGFNYNCQGPTDWVEKYETAPLPNIVEDGIGALMSDYVPEIIPALACLLIFGLISFIWLTCWSCGMMKCCIKKNCACAKCCANPMKCTQKSPCNVIMVVVALVLATCVFSVALAGWENNKAQNDAVDSVGSVLGIMGEWAGATQDSITVTDTAYGKLVVESKATEAEAATMATTEFRALTDIALPEVTSSLVDSKSAFAEMTVIFSDIDELLEDTSVSFQDQIDTLNGYRHTLVLSGGIILVCLMAFQLFAMSINQFAPACSKKTKCCFSAITFFYVWVLFFLTIIVTVIAVIVFILSDFCAAPNENFKMFMDLENTTFGYYIDCDHRLEHADGTQFNNPFNIQVEDVFDGSNVAQANIQLLATTDLAAANDEVQASSVHSAAYKTNAEDELAVLTKILSDLSDSLGSVTDTIGSGGLTMQGIASGVFGNMHCYALNPRKTAMINQVCDPLHGSIAQQFEYLVVALVLMVIIEVLKRMSRSPRDQQELADNKVSPMDQSADPYDV